VASCFQNFGAFYHSGQSVSQHQECHSSASRGMTRKNSHPLNCVNSYDWRHFAQLSALSEPESVMPVIGDLPSRPYNTPVFVLMDGHLCFRLHTRAKRLRWYQSDVDSILCS